VTGVQTCALPIYFLCTAVAVHPPLVNLAKMLVEEGGADPLKSDSRDGLAAVDTVVDSHDEPPMQPLLQYFTNKGYIV